MKKTICAWAFAAAISVSGGFVGTAHAKGSGTGSTPYTCTATFVEGSATQGLTSDASEDKWEALYMPGAVIPGNGTVVTASCTGD